MTFLVIHPILRINLIIIQLIFLTLFFIDHLLHNFSFKLKIKLYAEKITLQEIRCH